MSIFVNDEVFPLEQKFSVIYHKQTNKPIGLFLEPDDAEGDNVLTVECFAKGRDWEKFAMIEETCTVLARDNERLLRTYILYPEIILNFFVAWNVKKGKDKTEVPIDRNNIKKIHHSMVKALAKKWMKMTGGKSYVKSV
jgi:hypothetical protein